MIPELSMMTFMAMSLKPIFIDTGGLVATVYSSDHCHEVAAAYYRQLGPRVRVTTDLVVAETVTWLRYKVGRDAALRMAEELLTGEETGLWEIIRPGRLVFLEALVSLRKFASTKLSWTDAVSFAVCRQRGLEEVFGFDQHFYLAGLVLVPGVA